MLYFVFVSTPVLVPGSQDPGAQGIVGAGERRLHGLLSHQLRRINVELTDGATHQR